MGFHSYRVSQPRTQPGSLRNEIVEAMRNDKRRPKLESVHDDYFVISVGQGRQASFYRVPYSINEANVLNLDFTQEVQINSKLNNNGKGGKDMSDEKLLPPGINKQENQTDEKDLKALQEEADRKGLLLPAHMNRTGKKPAQKQEDGNVLLPTGLNK